MNKQYLDKGSLESLKFIKGKNIQSILSGNFMLDIDSNVITSTSISVPINNFKAKYLTITNDWFQTSQYGIDYCNLEIRISNTPKDIETTDDKNLKSSLIHHQNLSSLGLGKEKKISKIKIYTYSEKYLSEEVKYDSAILFETKNGIFEPKEDIKFLIKNQFSISGYLEIVTDPEIIKLIINEMEMRMVL